LAFLRSDPRSLNRGLNLSDETATQNRARDGRQFSASEKRMLLSEADRCKERGELGAFLRRKHIYSSMLSSWRKQLGAADSAALAPQRRGPKPDVAARQLIAKTYTVGENVNPSTGNIDATAIGQALKNGAPLTDELKTIADFANSAPRIASVPNGAALPTSPLNTAAGVMAAHSTGGLSLGIIPAARAFAAKWLQCRNENPAMLQPASASFGQTALDAIHGDAAAFEKMYGSNANAGMQFLGGSAKSLNNLGHEAYYAAPGAVVSTEDQASGNGSQQAAP
jgi:hypothetical protein